MAPTDMGHPRLGNTHARTHTHTCTHANTQTPQKSVASHHGGTAKQREHACLIHNLPFQHVRVLMLCTVTPNPHPLSPTHPVGSQKKRWTRLAENERAHMGVRWSQQHFLFPTAVPSVMEVQHSKLILFLSRAYTCPFSPSIFVFPKRVSLFTAHHPTSRRLCLTVRRWHALWGDDGEAGRERERGGPVGPVLTLICLFSFRKRNGFGKQKWMIVPIVRADPIGVEPISKHCRFWQRYREKYSVGKKTNTGTHKTILLSARFPGFVSGQQINVSFKSVYNKQSSVSHVRLYLCTYLSYPYIDLSSCSLRNYYMWMCVWVFGNLHTWFKKGSFSPRLLMLNICESCLCWGQLQFGLKRETAEWDLISAQEINDGVHKSCKLVIRRVWIGRQVLRCILIANICRHYTFFLLILQDYRYWWCQWSGEMIRKWPPKQNID